MNLARRLGPRFGALGLDPSKPAEHRYRVLAKIARTETVEDLLAEVQTPSGPRQVMLRRLLSEIDAHHEFVEMFCDEVERALLLDHPNLVDIYELGGIDGTHFVAMEWVHGSDLTEMMAQPSFAQPSASERNTPGRPIPRAQALPRGLAVHIACETLRALTYAHGVAEGDKTNITLIHHGVSPWNIRVTFEGHVKLCSLGMSRRAEHRGESAYMAPERLAGKLDDARSDLYSVGILLYEMSVGVHPFATKEESSIGSSVADRNPPEPAQFDSTFPNDLSEVLRKALDKDPSKRFDNAAAMRNVLLALTDDTSTQKNTEPIDFGEFLATETMPDALWRSRSATSAVPAVPEIPSKEMDRASPTRRVGRVARVLLEGVNTSAPNNEHLQVEFMWSGIGAIVKLSGEIDEAFNGRRFLSEIPTFGPVVFDLDGVHRITSYGVREWIQTLKEVRAEYYCFTHCRPSIVAQFNMVTNFGASGDVVSVYAPYVCKDCGFDFQRLFDLRRERAQITAHTMLDARCAKCGGAAEFDDHPESYFAYPLSGPPLSIPPQVESLIDGTSPSLQANSFRARKEVAGSMTVLWLSGRLDDDARFKRIADGLEGRVLLEAARLIHPTESGVDAFLQFLRSASANISLARVPPDLSIALAKRREFGRARVVSVLVPVRCASGSCKWKGHLDVEAPLDWVSDGQAAEQVCPGCMKGLIIPAPSQELARALRTLPATAPDEITRRHLAECSERPTLRRAPSPFAPAEETNAAPGVIRFGKYELLRRIGMGGMAEVFLARQVGPEGFKKMVALKRILPHLTEQKGFVELFLREARIAARLSHPNVVQIIDLGLEQGGYFITMEYVNGWDLNTILGLSSKLRLFPPVEVACRVVSDVCAGLNAAHEWIDEEGRRRPIIHRDISPHNVLISSEGNVKLSDFGIAKAADSTALTSGSEVRGKIGYIAPERIASNDHSADARSDIFSTGVVLYECLVLRTLFRRTSGYSTIRALNHDPVPPMTQFRRDISPVVEGVIHRATERDPRRRYQTIRDLQSELEEFLTTWGKPASATNVASWVRMLFERGGVDPERGGIGLTPKDSVGIKTTPMD